MWIRGDFLTACSLNLENHVLVPTIDSGHILDLVICDSNQKLIQNVHIEPDYFYSDHKLITFSVDVPIKIKKIKKISFRSIKNMDLAVFCESIERAYAVTVARGCQCNQMCENEFEKCLVCLILGCDMSISSVFEEMCPIINKEITECDFCPWYNSDIKKARNKRRKAETVWRRSRTDADRTEYVYQRNIVNRLLSLARMKYFDENISACGNDYKKLYLFLNNLLGKCRDVSLPEHDSSRDLADDFAKFFVSKIAAINSALAACNYLSVTYMPDLPYAQLSKFEDVRKVDVLKLIKKMKRTCCLGDPVNFTGIKSESFDLFLAGVYMKIINSSFETAVFPDTQKIAYVHPLLKKGLDANNMKSYRPISHLTFLSKVLESAALGQLSSHLNKINALSQFQSAYRPNHSTETALCRVYNDMILNMDAGKCTLLLLLDLSAAFDTVDHCLLLDDLFSLGVTGGAFQWFRSYLANRRFCVVIEDKCSDMSTLTTGVPQGSILGPILFIIYTIGLSYLLDEFGIDYHFYADDTQLYVVVDNVNSTTDLLEMVLTSIENWMVKK
jgi:hypothetical protein